MGTIAHNTMSGSERRRLYLTLKTLHGAAVCLPPGAGPQPRLWDPLFVS